MSVRNVSAAPSFCPVSMARGYRGLLYVMIGPMIYRYRTSDLVLQSSVELPKPEFPELAENH